METFIAVVELRSFSRAAERLNVQQSTVSRRVAELEAYLRAPLLARTTREVKPTEVGDRYYQAARAAQAAVETARATATTITEGLSGTLRVGTSTLFGETWLAPRLPQWLDRHPGVRLELALHDAHVDLVSSGIDLSLRFGGPSTSELRGRRLRTFSRVVLASPGWIERNGAPRHPSALQDCRALMYGGSGAREWTLRSGEERVTIRPQRSVAATTGGVLDRLARHDVGPVLAPEWLAEPREMSRELQRVLPDWEGPEMVLWVVWPNHDFQTSTARRFVDWVASQVGETGV